MKIAVLCNCYPAVSHSFVRREILALEDQGHEVRRISIRASKNALPDPADREEAGRTFVVLGRGIAPLLLAAAKAMLSRPGATFKAFLLAIRMGKNSAALLRNLAYFAEACLIVGRLRRDPVDHLHAHFGTNPAAVARLMRRLGGPPYSFTAHGPDEFDAPIQLDLAGKIADAAFAVAISNFGRSQLMRWSPPSEWDKIVVVRCGLDQQFLGAAVSPAPDVPRLCSVARLSGQKGLPLLIEAAGMLKDRGVPFQLDIVGDGELRTSIEAQIANLGLGEQVRLVGSKSAEEVRSYLTAARLFVLPSFAEGLPVVIMEALALARPVVVTAIAGTPELVDEECGWLIPAGSAEALRNALETALAAPIETVRNMGEEGRRRVIAAHDAAANAKALAGHAEAHRRMGKAVA
jgi:colanic acid/amylovoran biosynthesis glycosyltransferase